ncbi:MAG: hypothetical protein NC548_25360 [Lachnospiraceae bacterium]|nr:hypothetical protein [Lachnospiraceae bacterium]
MKALEYIFREMKDRISYDEGGNMYIDVSGSFQRERICIPTVELDESALFISREDCDKYNQYEFLIADDIGGHQGIVRRPYYRMRGKPVSREQAFDIIRRTDRFFALYMDEISSHADYVGGYHFPNWLIDRTHFPGGYGWIHADGTVGTNGITGTYPGLYELIGECFGFLRCFPYLDLVVAVSGLDEIPAECQNLIGGDYERKMHEFQTSDERFCKEVAYGICIHDKTLEVIRPADAVKRYKKYASFYGKDKEKYLPEYYSTYGIRQVDLPYLKKCIEAYGIDADEAIRKAAENMYRVSRR